MTKIYLTDETPTWREIVGRILRPGFAPLPLSSIYDEVERLFPKRVAANAHWKAKVRQALQLHPGMEPMPGQRGIWRPRRPA